MQDTNQITVFRIIKLKPGISIANYLAIILHNVVLGFFLNGIEFLQQNILSDPNYYNLAAEDALETNANITLFDLVVRLIITGFYGLLIDKLGRRKMVIAGYIVTTIGVVLFPIDGYDSYFDNVFPWYYLIRFIYSNGAAIVTLMPFIADYIEDESKGKATGINTVALTIGFLLATSGVKLFYNDIGMNLKYVYLITAGCIFFFGMFYAYFLKGGNEYYRVTPVPVPKRSDASNFNNNIPESQSAEQPKVINFKYMIRAINERPWIKASFIFALLNGANMGIVSQILSLFVRSLSNDPNSDAGSEVSQFANIGGIIITVVLGVMLDYVAPLYISATMLVFSVAGYATIWGVHSATDGLMIFVGVVAGISYSSTQLFMNYLGFIYYPSEIRGRLYAAANVMSLLGNLIVTVIGGNLVRYLTQYAPFYFTIALTVIGLALFIVLYLKSIRKWERRKNKIASVDSQSLLLPEEKDTE